MEWIAELRKEGVFGTTLTKLRKQKLEYINADYSRLALRIKKLTQSIPQNDLLWSNLGIIAKI